MSEYRIDYVVSRRTSSGDFESTQMGHVFSVESLARAVRCLGEHMQQLQQALRDRDAV